MLRRNLGLPVSWRARRHGSEPKKKDVIVLGDLEELRRIDGIWYRLRYLPLTEASWPKCGCRHCRSRRPPSHNGRPLAEKRQLSKAELRRRGLSNEVAL